MGKLESFKLFLWDPNTRKCMGRTGDSWLKLIGFYIALYSCLAAIWAMYYALFHLTISDKYPKWQLDESIIGTNPGVGIRPSSPKHRVESALIKFTQGPEGDFKHWVEDLSSYLDEIHHSPGYVSWNQDIDGLSPNQSSTFADQFGEEGAQRGRQVRVNCSANRTAQELEETICPFDNSSIPAECTATQNYSFPMGAPCILIKLNRIYGWRPQPYSSKPPKYPEGTPFTPGNIQITCEGQHDTDKEHVGPIEYFPSSGIATKYYPFMNQPGYQSPYVMVHFKSPRPNTLIYIECKAWAENVEHDRYNKKGMTTFELFVEKPFSAGASGSSR